MSPGLATSVRLLPPTNMPDPSKQGVKKLDPTDATQNLGLFLANQEDHHLSIVDYKEVLGYQNEALGFGVRAEVARKAGDMMGLIVFGSFITEASLQIFRGTREHLHYKRHMRK